MMTSEHNGMFPAGVVPWPSPARPPPGSPPGLCHKLGSHNPGPPRLSYIYITGLPATFHGHVNLICDFCSAKCQLVPGPCVFSAKPLATLQTLRPWEGRQAALQGLTCTQCWQGPGGRCLIRRAAQASALGPLRGCPGACAGPSGLCRWSGGFSRAPLVRAMFTPGV